MPGSRIAGIIGDPEIGHNVFHVGRVGQFESSIFLIRDLVFIEQTFHFK